MTALDKHLWPERAVSRVLFPAAVTLGGAVTIPLGPPLPTASSNQPGSLGRAALKHSPIRSCSGWGLPSCRRHRRHWWALTSPFHPGPPTPRHEVGGLLSVALSLGSPPVPVRDHPALRSPDFPPPTLASLWVASAGSDRLSLSDHETW